LNETEILKECHRKMVPQLELGLRRNCDFLGTRIRGKEKWYFQRSGVYRVEDGMLNWYTDVREIR
jgi:hypothetical protein